MWFVMEKVQNSHATAEKLLRAVNNAGSAAKSSSSESRKMHQTFLITIQDLIEDGADLNTLHGTMLPLHCACFTGDVATVKLLIRYGAMVNIPDGYDRHPLHYAAEQCSACVKTLLENGAEVDARDRHGNTPLHWAAYKNHPDSVRYLLDYGADPNALDQNRDSALSWAALKGHYETISLLLDYNCRPDTRNLSGSSPLSRLAQTIAIGIGSAQEEACIGLLIKALGQFDLRHNGTGFLDTDLQDDDVLRELVLPYCFEPRTLKQFCRYSVRESLGAGHLASRVKSLPIPDNLCRYLLLEQ